MCAATIQLTVKTYALFSSCCKRIEISNDTSRNGHVACLEFIIVDPSLWHVRVTQLIKSER